jgi:hypothetical protein
MTGCMLDKCQNLDRCRDIGACAIALAADGEKLRQLTGEDHGPFDLRNLAEEVRYRFREAREKAECSPVIAPNSYGAGYDLGYSDALGELLEWLEDQQIAPSHIPQVRQPNSSVSHVVGQAESLKADANAAGGAD